MGGVRWYKQGLVKHPATSSNRELSLKSDGREGQFNGLTRAAGEADFIVETSDLGRAWPLLIAT